MFGVPFRFKNYNNDHSRFSQQQERALVRVANDRIKEEKEARDKEKLVAPIKALLGGSYSLTKEEREAVLITKSLYKKNFRYLRYCL